MARLTQRIRKLEEALHVGAPTKLFAPRSLAPGEAKHLLENWREEVAAGRAGVSGPALYVRVQKPTVEEWMAEHGNGYADPELE
jgi:hypothetical protein